MIKDHIISRVLLLLLLLSRFSRVRLCDPIDGSPPGSPVPGVLQARTLEWVAISFSNIKGTGLIFTDHSRITFRCHDRLSHVPPAGYKGHRCLSPPLPSWDSDSDTDQGPPRLLLSKSRSSFPPGADPPLPQPTFPFPFWPALKSHRHHPQLPTWISAP